METTSNNLESFVTVVSVGHKAAVAEPSKTPQLKESAYITVLTIGDGKGDQNTPPKDITEEVLVYRLPGERLGFGLKFDGGTKANEFVNRLYIQSCAPDSPASRVQSTWGTLIEGDEVIEIDSIKVNTMTRTDCVKCLKDSNVVIKLLVRHFGRGNKSTEDLPQVISAEKKRIPPPPPPVPPRKIPKRPLKSRNIMHEDNLTGPNPVPAIRHSVNNESGSKKFQSPRSSGRLKSQRSPDIHRHERRFHDPINPPPDAEVYVDLFSAGQQDALNNLSESDDTGSSISTVVDRYGSFPTTTSSSLAGSLPSTPTSVQKHLDFSHMLSCFDDEELPNPIIARHEFKLHSTKPLEVNEKNSRTESSKEILVQPTSYFQDAPLSYGNEDMRTLESTESDVQVKIFKKPPVPARFKDTVLTHNVVFNNDQKDNDVNGSDLPRLVDFVPKTVRKTDSVSALDSIDVFLDREKFDSNMKRHDEIESEAEIFNSKWCMSSHLSTIGEVEEESQDSFSNKSLPMLAVAENSKKETKEEMKSNSQYSIDEPDTISPKKDVDGNMESLPSDSRQPPDGHEFPDYVESTVSVKIQHKTYPNFYNEKHLMINDSEPTIRSNYTKRFESGEQTKSSLDNDLPKVYVQNKFMNKITSVSNSDLSTINDKEAAFDDAKNMEGYYKKPHQIMHTRSQSLSDMSVISKQGKTDRWSLLAEQRRKSLSKLKGLVIPEHVNETETATVVNIPEINNSTANSAPFISDTNTISNLNNDLSRSIDKISITLPPWSSMNNTIPKYSPAFKRKNLQLYSSPVKLDPIKTDRLSLNLGKGLADLKLTSSDLRIDNLSDCPKSLESISSPTKSDCSFDYISNKNKNKLEDTPKEGPNFSHKIPKSEDESDNDSAVSSSQSSYMSRCSPTNSYDISEYDSKSKLDIEDKYNRLLKPASVEAINRKNILASAKCRSGKDLKVGSPVIERKYEENNENCSTSLITSPSEEPVPLTVEPVLCASDKEIAPDAEKCNNFATNHSSRPEKITPITRKNSNNNNSNDGEVDLIKPMVVLKAIPVRVQKNHSELSLPRNSVDLSHSRATDFKFGIKNVKSLSVTDLRKSFEKFNDAPLLPTFTSKTLIPKPVARQSQAPIKESKPKPEDIPKPAVIDIKTKGETKIQPKTMPIAQSETLAVRNQRKVTLLPEFVGGSIGVTLSGGIDYETKDVAIYKIRYGSVAYKEGSLKKGDRIISINGTSTSGLSHTEAVNLLKEPVAKFVLIIEDGKEIPRDNTPERRSSLKKTLEDNKTSKTVTTEPPKSVTHVVTLTKDGSGLGFSIEGGKNSVQGDLPLKIKKIFPGGAADKSVDLRAGDEILTINDVSVVNLSKIEVWSLMKKIKEGPVLIHIHR